MKAELLRSTGIGVLAGAIGTLVLNVATYADVAARGRASSSAPADVVGQAANRLGVHAIAASNQSEKAANRRSGLGALSGYAAGVGTAAVYGLSCGRGFRPPTAAAALILGLGAMAAADGPIAALGVSDPRTWSVADWLSDVVPHLLYGATSAAVYSWADKATQA